MTAILDLGPIVDVTCCRVWPVYVLWPLRKCGECGRVPTQSKESS